MFLGKQGAGRLGTFPGPARTPLLQGRSKLVKGKELGCFARACSAELLQLEMFIIAVRRMLLQILFEPERELQCSVRCLLSGLHVLCFRKSSVKRGTYLGGLLSSRFLKKRRTPPSSLVCFSLSQPGPPTHTSAQTACLPVPWELWDVWKLPVFQLVLLSMHMDARLLDKLSFWFPICEMDAA